MNDEIDLKEYLKFIKSKIYRILLFSFIICLTGSLYKGYVGNFYVSTSLIIPQKDTNSSDFIDSNLGNLASFAGLNIPSETDKSDVALEILKSKKFIDNFLIKRGILKDIFALNSWNKESNTLVYDLELLDKDSIRLIDSFKISNEKAHDEWLDNIFNFQRDSKTGFIRLNITHRSPHRAEEILDWLITDLNNEMRDIDVNEAELSLNFLYNGVSEITNIRIKEIYYRLIESYTEKKMLAFSRQDYVFKVIDPPAVSEKPIGLSFWILFFTLFFTGFGIIFFFYSAIFYIFDNKNFKDID